MIGIAIAALIPLAAYVSSRWDSGLSPYAKRPTAEPPEPPPFTEDQIFGPAPSASAPAKPAPIAPAPIAAKAPPPPPPPAPPEPPPMPEAEAMPTVDAEPAPPAPPPAALPAPVEAAPVAAMTERQRLEAMAQELRDLIEQPTPENLARLRDPANRAAFEHAFAQLIAAGMYLDLVALARRLMEPLPSRADIEAVAIAPTPPPVAPPAVDATAPSAAPSAGPPEGYDPAKARRLAGQVAANIESKKYSYSRKLLSDFQKFAGIEIDGIYAGQSRAALAHFGVKRPPRALFAPLEDQPYPWA